MAKEIKLKKVEQPVFVDQDSSWLALDVPEIKPPLYASAFIIFLGLFFTTGLIYSAVTNVPVIVQAVGKLNSEKPAVPIRATANFTVEMILVKENQIVKAGENLVLATSDVKLAELHKLQTLNRELQILSSKQKLLGCADCNRALANALTVANSLLAFKKIIPAALPIVEVTKDIALTMIELKKVDDSLTAKKTRLAQLSKSQTRVPASTNPATQLEIGQIQNQIQADHAPYLKRIDKAHAKLKNQALEFSNYLERLILASGTRAPIDGKIVNVRIKGQGELIGSGQTIMEIVPIDNRLLAQIEVSNKDIGTIKAGDNVEISVDAFPEMDYGTLRGEVEDILPVENNENSAQPAGPERGFRVRVSLEAQQMKSGQNSLPLIAGMTVRARIEKKKETLLKTFYRSVFRMKDQLRARI